MFRPAFTWAAAVRSHGACTENPHRNNCILVTSSKQTGPKRNGSIPKPDTSVDLHVSAYGGIVEKFATDEKDASVLGGLASESGTNCTCGYRRNVVARPPAVKPFFSRWRNRKRSIYARSQTRLQEPRLGWKLGQTKMFWWKAACVSLYWWKWFKAATVSVYLEKKNNWRV